MFGGSRVAHARHSCVRVPSRSPVRVRLRNEISDGVRNRSLFVRCMDFETIRPVFRRYSHHGPGLALFELPSEPGFVERL